MIKTGQFEELALSLPGVVELPHFDKISFRFNKKIFATLDVKNNRACVKLSKTDQSVFCAYNKEIIYPVPNKWGIHGATFIELKSVTKPMLKDILKQAYNRIAESKISAGKKGK